MYEAGLVRLPSDILDLADNMEGLAGLGKGWGAKSAARVANEVSRVLEEVRQRFIIIFSVAKYVFTDN